MATASSDKEFALNQYIVYGTNGICCIAGQETHCFDGTDEKDYYKLIPINSENSVYYIPTDNMSKKVRALISKNEVYSLIDKIPEIESLWPQNTNERKNLFKSMLKSGDYEKIICVIKSYKEQQKKRKVNNKRLSALDEQTMKNAEGKMYQEFAMVLNVNEDDMPSIIHKRLGNRLQ